MRLLLRLVIGLCVLIALAGVALALLLPRMIESPRFRAAVSQQAEARLGRSLEFGELAVGLLPPSIVVESPTIAGRSRSEPPLLRADALSLRLALLPLLGGVILVDSLSVEGAAVHLVRTAEGIALPAAGGTTNAQAEPADAAPKGDTGSALSLAVRSLTIRDSRLVLVDETQVPAITWSLEQVRMDATGTSPDAPIDVELAARLGSGGGLAARGSVSLGGRVDLDLQLDQIALAAASPYLGRDARLDAELSGGIEMRGAPAAPERLDLQLELRSQQLALGDTRVRGPVGIRLSLAGDLAAPSGGFELDASRAAIAQADSFRKPEGTAAKLAGRFSRRADGALTVDVERLTLASLQGSGKLELGKKTTLRLEVPAFDIAGFGALIPALEPYRPSGSLAFKGLTLTPEPLALRGVVAIDGLRIALAEGRAIALGGRIEGRGDALEFADFDVDAGGQHIAVRGDLKDLPGKRRLALHFVNAGVLRAKPLLAAISSQGDSVEGPLELEGDLAVELGGAAASSLDDSLRGSFGFRLGEGAGDGKEGGRLEGVSVLRSVFAGMGDLQQTLRLAGAFAGQDGADLESFFGEEFQRMEGHFSLARGLIETRDLRILYRDYGVKLRGAVRLAGLALDLTGEVELGPQVVSALGADPKQGSIVVPLTKVTGTVSDPEFRLSKQAVSALSQQLLTRSGTVNELTKEADKYVPGASDLLKKGLGGLLGGGKRE